jgi:plastocyanin
MPELAIGQSNAITGNVFLQEVPADGAVVHLYHESVPIDATTAETFIIDQRSLRFVPQVLSVLPGQEVQFRNSDPLFHNVFSPDTLGEDFDLGTYPAGQWRSHRFRRPGVHPILCHVHPEMEAYVVVVTTPYHGVSDSTGRFRVGNLPPGTFALEVWHRRAAPYTRTVTVRENSDLRLEIRLDGRRSSLRARR